MNVCEVRFHQVLGTEWGFLSSAGDEPWVSVTAEKNYPYSRVIPSHRRCHIQARWPFAQVKVDKGRQRTMSTVTLERFRRCFAGPDHGKPLTGEGFGQGDPGETVIVNEEKCFLHRPSMVCQRVTEEGKKWG